MTVAQDIGAQSTAMAVRTVGTAVVRSTVYSMVPIVVMVAVDGPAKIRPRRRGAQVRILALMGLKYCMIFV